MLRQKRQTLRGLSEDIALFLTGRRDPELPPVRLRFVGMGEFRQVGDELVRLLVTTGGLRPSDRVLDIGCGVGRVAIPLTKVLSAGATYDGFDVVRGAVRWCARHITARHPNFRFTHANLFNSYYNRSGVPASGYRFPYEDGAFDFAFATSVFTHLDLAATRRYIAETRRVLRRGGSLLATFFILGGPEPGLGFGPAKDGYSLLDPNTPDAAIAFEERLVRELFAELQWRVVRLERGAWSGQPDAPTFQDVVVAERL